MLPVPDVNCYSAAAAMIIAASTSGLEALRLAQKWKYGGENKRISREMCRVY